MILFLTSSPCDDDHVPEGLSIPCVYNRANGFADALRDCVRPGAAGLIIAASPDGAERNDLMAQTFADCFAEAGMPLSRMELLDSRTEDRAAELVRGADVILLGGGHVPTQNAFFARMGLRELLAGKDCVVMGISAGTMNAADTVYCQPEEPGEAVDPLFRRWIPGLGLTDVNILPHYQQVKDNILDGMRLFEDVTYGDSCGHDLIALPDGSYVREDSNGATVFGEAYLIRDGVLRQICRNGENLPLPCGD